MTDDQITMEFLEQQRTAIAQMPKGAKRDEAMRLNCWTRSLLEATGCHSVAELTDALPQLKTKGMQNANAAN